MATKQDQQQEFQQQQAHISQRRAINNAYAAILGERTTQTFAAFTFEDAVDLQLERIEGGSDPLRPNELDRVDRIESQLIQAVAQLKEVPPEQFLAFDAGKDVNTAEGQG